MPALVAHRDTPCGVVLFQHPRAGLDRARPLAAWQIGFGLIYTMAIFFKESALVMPGLAVALIVILGPGSLVERTRRFLPVLFLLLPIALQLAKRFDIPPSRTLMPLAFGTILGGMTTLIGTPPNLIVAGFRASNGDGFGMFDFSPVGGAVALTGLGFLALLGWSPGDDREVMELPELIEAGNPRPGIRLSAVLAEQAPSPFDPDIDRCRMHQRCWGVAFPIAPGRNITIGRLVFA